MIQSIYSDVVQAIYLLFHKEKQQINQSVILYSLTLFNIKLKIF